MILYELGRVEMACMDYAAKGGLASASGVGRRAYPRHHVGLLAVLMTIKNEFICTATVQNMSGGGAKLVLSGGMKVMPDHFVMALSSSSGPRRECSLVWQSNNVMGVRFVKNANQDGRLLEEN